MPICLISAPVSWLCKELSFIIGSPVFVETGFEGLQATTAGDVVALQARRNRGQPGVK